MKTLLLLRGAQGAGKTTFASMICELAGESAIMLAADDWFVDSDGQYRFEASQLGRAHDQCKTRTEYSMTQDIPLIIVHNTFAKENEIRPYERLAETHGYKLVSLVIENRHGNKDVHSVPQEVRVRVAETIRANLKLI